MRVPLWMAARVDVRESVVTCAAERRRLPETRLTNVLILPTSEAARGAEAIKRDYKWAAGLVQCESRGGATDPQQASATLKYGAEQPQSVQACVARTH